MKLGIFIFGILAAGHLLAEQPPATEVFAKVDYEQRLGSTLPLNAPFVDESGRAVRLGSYFGQRPAIIAFAYYRCPNLCTIVLNGALDSLRNLPWTIGKEFDVVVISIDPADTPVSARAKKDTYALRYGRPGSASGWHFLTGGEESIREVTEAAGFHYTYDPATQQFAHASGMVVATPAGKIARYFLGIEYPPKEVRTALVEAAHERVGTLSERLLLLCFHYNPHLGRYGALITRVVQFAGLGTVLGLGVFIIRLHRARREALAP